MSWNRRNDLKNSNNEDTHEDLLVFGYSSRLYPNDDQAINISEERHMVPCIGDSMNRVDRYDCRLLLNSIDEALGDLDESFEECPTDSLENEMCEEERYKDLYIDIKRQKEIEEEEERRKQSSSKATIGFDYGTGIVNSAVQENDSDSEDEPFEAPPGVKFPVGLELPPNMKLHHIIEKTASFVVANGAQMEIVIKAKQRNNMEQFGFMNFDNSLYPFYKYLQKLIREKKYTPDMTKKKKKKPPAVTGALAAIAAAHGSDSDDEDDSDSDCELHPSLLGGGVKKPPSPLKPGVFGPASKPNVVEKAPKFEMRQRNDVYASLFKNLADVTRQATGKGPEQIKKEEEEVKIDEGRVDDPEYREWFEMFYKTKCPWIGPKPMIPPTPDLEPVLNSYAEYVARKGCEFEKSLAGRADLQLHFMDPKSPYFSYYHQKIRMFQWQMTQDLAQIANRAPPSNYASPVNSPTVPAVPSPVVEQQPPMNRAQRRRMLESTRGFGGEVAKVAEPGVVDPVMKPISFAVAQKVEENGRGSHEESASTSMTFDPDTGEMVSRQVSPINGTNGVFDGLEPPAPPSILNNTQLDRKEKARIFMEKLLAEKKLKKAKEEEEKVEKVAEVMGEEKTNRPTISTIDDIINKRISSILSESGFKEEEERKKKKHKRRSRSRSSEDRRKKSKKDRKRSRSRSKERRRRRSRSRSRDHHRRY